MARTGENIYKRKDGRWEARYITSYDANGKDLYHKPGFLEMDRLTLIPDLINPFFNACCMVSFNISSRISSVILVFLNFVKRLGLIMGASGSRSKKYLKAMSVWALLINRSSDKS